METNTLLEKILPFLRSTPAVTGGRLEVPGRRAGSDQRTSAGGTQLVRQRASQRADLFYGELLKRLLAERLAQSPVISLLLVLCSYNLSSTGECFVCFFFYRGSQETPGAPADFRGFPRRNASTCRCRCCLAWKVGRLRSGKDG